MAKYGKAAGKSVKSAMKRKKSGTLKSGKGGKGGTVKSKKQAIAIGLSEARRRARRYQKRRAADTPNTGTCGLRASFDKRAANLALAHDRKPEDVTSFRNTSKNQFFC
jgi:hypothetical protein